jgi:hypothetical protein
MHFDAPSCPTGWTELTAARGRVLVGLPAGGTPGLTVGAGLGNGGSRTITSVPAHTHVVDPPSTGTSSPGNHTHQVGGSGADDNNHTGNGDFLADSDANLQSWRNTTGGGNHSHSVDIAAFTSASAGVASVDVSMPYLQLILCRKDVP